MTKRTRRAATICTILLLVLLFTMPRAYLVRTVGEMNRSAAEAEALSRTGGDPADALTRLSVQYDRYSSVWRMFLDHVSVDAVGAAIAACTPLTEPDALVAALHTVNAALSHLLGIESLAAESLL